MAVGRVIEYNAESGVGIIMDNQTGWQVSVYKKNILLAPGEILYRGQNVQYECAADQHSAGAINVKVI